MSLYKIKNLLYQKGIKELTEKAKQGNKNEK